MIVKSTTDVPDGDLGRQIFLVRRNDIDRWVVFQCPGGHKKRIEANLMRSRWPYWDAKIKNGKITLSPSIAVEDNICDCHFWIEENIAIRAYFSYLEH